MKSQLVDRRLNFEVQTFGSFAYLRILGVRIEKKLYPT